MTDGTAMGLGPMVSVDIDDPMPVTACGLWIELVTDGSVTKLKRGDSVDVSDTLTAPRGLDGELLIGGTVIGLEPG